MELVGKWNVTIDHVLNKSGCIFLLYFYVWNFQNYNLFFVCLNKKKYLYFIHMLVNSIGSSFMCHIHAYLMLAPKASRVIGKNFARKPFHQDHLLKHLLLLLFYVSIVLLEFYLIVWWKLGFRDHSLYKGHQVFLYKRAQIFVADLWGAFKGEGYGKFNDIGSITIFADYIIPAVLRELGILKYSSALSDSIDSKIEVYAGSEEEVEIRACSIYAVEKMRELIKSKFKKQVSKLPT